MRRLLPARDTWALSLAGFLLLLAYSHRAGHDLNWDFLNYHFYAGYMLVAGRLGVDLLPAMMQTYLNPLPYVVPYLTIRHLPPFAAAAVLTALHALNLTAVYVFAKTAFADRPRAEWVPAALLCVAIALTGPSFLAQVGASTIDIATSVLLIFGLTGAVQHVRGGGWRPLVVAGLLFGAASGLKQTNALFVLGLGVALLAVAGPWRERLARGLTFGASAAGAALALALPWMAAVYREFGNPLFPFYNTIFRSPLGPIANPGDYSFFPATYWEGLAWPLAWLVGQNPAGEIPFRDARFLVLGVLVLAAAAAWALRPGSAVAPAPTADRWSRVALGLAAYLALSHAVWVTVLRTSHPVMLGALTILGAVPLAWWLVRRGAPAPSAAPAPPSAEPRVAVLLGVYLVVCYAIWLKVFAVERYLLHIELVAGVLMAVLLHRVWRRGRGRAVAFAALSLLVVLWAQPTVLQRVPWGGPWIPAVLPAAAQAPNVLYLMTGHEPYACLVPLMPASAVFLRIDGNFPLAPDTPLGKQVLTRLARHDGEVRAMIPLKDEPGALAKLATFGLRPVAHVGTITYVQGPITLVRLARSPAGAGGAPGPR